jgi:MOSC domain-containing protein
VLIPILYLKGISTGDFEDAPGLYSRPRQVPQAASTRSAATPTGGLTLGWDDKLVSSQLLWRLQREANNMAPIVTAIYRYPVKGLSAEKMDRVALVVGACLPHDRRFAIALASTVFDPQRPEWLSKTHFIMLMRDEKLAQLQTRFDAESGVLAIAENGRELLREPMTDPGGCRLVAEFFAYFLGDAVNGSLRVVEAPGHAFADARRKPNATTDKYVSLINRASIAALEAAMGVPVDPMRFRANVYFDGASAWSEHDWVGSEITLGAARLRVVSPITRCATTQVNPITAKRDLDIVAALGRAFGHINMGVYAEVLAGGEIAVGDALLEPQGSSTAVDTIYPRSAG